MKPIKILCGRIKIDSKLEKIWYGNFYGRGNIFNKEEPKQNLEDEIICIIKE